MQKADYIKLIQDRPWSEMEEYFNAQETLVIDRFCNLNVDEQPWIQFTLDNFDLAQQKWEYPKDHFSENEKKCLSMKFTLAIWYQLLSHKTYLFVNNVILKK